MADPVSWFLIERGWTVVDSAGNDVGKVDAVLGDQQKDIFDGLDVGHGLLGHSHYVPAEAVGTIVEGRIELLRTAADLGLG